MRIHDERAFCDECADLGLGTIRSVSGSSDWGVFVRPCVRRYLSEPVVILVGSGTVGVVVIQISFRNRYAASISAGWNDICDYRHHSN